MGLLDRLFGNEEAEKEAAAESAVIQALSKVEILKDLVATIAKNENEWVTKCTGYYDRRRRNITIGPDLCQIEWAEGHYENNEYVYDVHEVIRYSYTASGYRPLDYTNGVLKDRVVELWASVLRDSLQAAMSDCEFSEVGNISSVSHTCSFYYSVPKLTWKSWFEE